MFKNMTGFSSLPYFLCQSLVFVNDLPILFKAGCYFPLYIEVCICSSLVDISNFALYNWCFSEQCEYLLEFLLWWKSMTKTSWECVGRCGGQYLALHIPYSSLMEVKARTQIGQGFGGRKWWGCQGRTLLIGLLSVFS